MDAVRSGAWIVGAVVVWAVVVFPLAVAVGRAFAAGWDDERR